LRVVPWIFARAYSIAGPNTFLTFHVIGQNALILISLNVHQATEVHGIYQFDEAVQAISALKTPLRTGFLPVCLVHARTKLSDVYDVRPVNAEEESLPIGPYSYSSFPPLSQDQERVAVINEMSPSDVPDMSHLVTVDVESISSTARRDSSDIVGGSELGLTTVAKGSAVTITAYNGTTKVATLSSAISYTAGDVYSIGPIQSNEVGNVCGIFYIPNGYFKTGERIFRLDNRVVTQTATEFVYQKGTETTSSEATFFAQGLTQKVQEAEFSPSYASASKVVSQTQTQNFMIERTAVPTGGGGCCVVATALNARGTWSDGQKNTLIEWCEKHLHNKSLGECFRRGYQVIGSKLLVPGLNNKHTSGYLTWSWDNGTNMVMGKKFNPLSVPNSIFWIGMFMLVGSMVSTRYARKSWMSLYKKD
jgi:hypothetical protein